MDLQRIIFGYGENWSKNADGYIYYNTMLNPGESTSEITIDYSSKNNNNEYKIMYAIEYCNPSFNENGQAYSDWNFTIANI